MDNLETILILDINCKEIYEVKAEDKTIIQILFDGNASGDYFTGEVLPGGVDTQKGNPKDGTGRLSARYILDGKDYTGEKCRIYVENEADFGSSVTFPSIVTDSKALKWLNKATLTGELINDEKGLRIIIKAEKRG